MNQTEFIHTRLNSYSSTPQEPLVIDGKSYKTVKIGDQIWMAENLAYDDDKGGIYVKDGNYYYTWDAALRVAMDLNGVRLPSLDDLIEAVYSSGGKSEVSVDRCRPYMEGFKAMKLIDLLDIKAVGWMSENGKFHQSPRTDFSFHTFAPFWTSSTNENRPGIYAPIYFTTSEYHSDIVGISTSPGDYAHTIRLIKK